MDEPRKNPEQEVIDLLGRLKETGPEYPSEMMSQRRAAVLASLAAVPVAAGGILGISWLSNLLKIFKGMAIVDKIIVGVEVAAITGLTGYGAVTAYQYRYQIEALLFPNSVGTPFPTLSVPATLAVGGGGAGQQAGSPEATGTVTPTVTPLATWTGLPTIPVAETSAPVVPTAGPIQPTNPPPPPKATPTHGLHLGQTKTPKSP